MESILIKMYISSSSFKSESIYRNECVYQLEVKTLSHCLFVELNNRYELSINSLVFVSFGISITQCSVFYIC